MATIRLVPSTYSLSNSTYLSVSNANNMYADTDSTNYATVSNSQNGTTSYYIYIKGFNFSAIPAGARVSSWKVKLKASQSGGSTSSSYSPKLCNNTSQITSTCSAITTSVQTLTFTGVSLDWDTIVGYGANFGVRINCRRNNRNTAASFNIYGVEIEVEYTIPDPRTITSSLSGNGTISPSGAVTLYDGDPYELTIVPTNKSDPVTVTHNGTDVTSQLVPHYPASEASAVLGAYSLKSGGFNGSGASYFQGLVGKGHTASQTTSNYYSSGSGTNAVFQYEIDLDVPSGATITRLYMIANGHCENASQSSEYMCVQLKSGNTELSEQYNFKSHGTSNGNETIEAHTLPTAAQLANLVVECTLGYYGGAINGVTVYCEYSTGSQKLENYTYSFTVSGDATIAVVIGSPTPGTEQLYVKENGVWTAYSAVYKKVNGQWVLQSNLSDLFNENTKYVKGN